MENHIMQAIVCDKALMPKIYNKLMQFQNYK